VPISIELLGAPAAALLAREGPLAPALGSTTMGSAFEGGEMSSETTQILVIAVASGPAVFVFVHALERLSAWMDRRWPL
jgi:hypothetical protein